MLGVYSSGYGQSLSSLPVKVMVPTISAKTIDLNTQDDFVYEEIPIDLVFDKMAELETLVFTRKEIEAINTDVIYIENELYFLE